MNTFVTDLLAKEAEEPSESPGDDVAADVEDGPEDDESEGELPQDDDGETDEEEQEEPAEPEAEPEDEPKAEATVDPRDAEIEALKTLAQSQNQQLIDILAQQVSLMGTTAQAPRPTMPALSDEVAKLALFGGDEKAWQALNPQDRENGKKLAQEYMDRVTRHAKNPEALYEEQIRSRVLQDVHQMIAPLIQETHVKRGQEIIERHAKDLVGSHRAKLLEKFNELPGSRSESWKDLEATLKAAAALVRMEIKEEDLASRERKVEVSNLQKKANKEAAKRVGRRGSHRPADKNNTPGWDPAKMDLAQYAQRLSDKE
jgi:hypothetical protein